LRHVQLAACDEVEDQRRQRRKVYVIARGNQSAVGERCELGLSFSKAVFLRNDQPAIEFAPAWKKKRGQ
jgi:hypothetical protein